MTRGMFRTHVVAPAICLAAAAILMAAGEDVRVGTWSLDLTRSTFDPGPPPQRQTLWYKSEGDQLTALIQGVDAEGHPFSPDVGNLTMIFDGKDHQTPRPGYETSQWRRINAHKYIVYRKKGGKVVLTSTNVVSDDNRTLTITTEGTDESGRKVHNVRVYERVSSASEPAGPAKQNPAAGGSPR